VLVMRHGPAEDRDAWAARGRDEAARPLTRAGRDAVRRAVRGIRALLPSIDRLATSAYSRAAHTAELVAAAYDDLEPITLSALEPGGRRTDIVEWIDEAGAASTVAVIGHAPELDQLITWFLAGRAGDWVALRKGGAALLAFDGPSVARRRAARLAWCCTRSQLEQLSGA
jgi:phosphohistidine phosphatase